MGDGGGAHARLVGEHPPGHAVAHGRRHAVAHAAPQGGLGGEGGGEDPLQGGGQGGAVDDEHHNAAPQEQQGHAGHQLLADLPDAADAPQNHDPGDRRRHDTHRQPVPAEGGLQGGGDGVGLHHVAAPQVGAHAAQGEQAGQAPAAQPLLHVAHGPAPPAPGGVFFPVAHRQGFLQAAGHHAQKGGHPHPEHRPRPAVEDGGGHPGDGAGADGGGQGGGQGLEPGEALPLPPLLPPEQGAQGGFQPQGGPENLEEAGAHREVQPAQQKEPQQPGVPDEVAQPFRPRHAPTSCPIVYAGGVRNMPAAGWHAKPPESVGLRGFSLSKKTFSTGCWTF